MIALGCDHGGFALKSKIALYLESIGIEFLDFGTNSADSVDYPDFAEKACIAVTSGRCSKGILVCGSGIGISIAANKIRGIRAALCNDLYCAELSRRHNDANVLALGGRVVGDALALAIVEKWLNTDFEGGRHSKRIEKIHALEK